MDDPEITGDEQKPDTKFKPGQSGNPAGRPKGSKNKLIEHFIADVYEKWQSSGMDALDAMAQQDPGGFVKVVAGLMPKEVKIDVTDERTDQQIEHSIRLLASQLGLALDLIAGTQSRIEGTATAEGPDETQPLQTVQ